MDLQYYKTFNEDTSQGVVGLLRPLNKKGGGTKVLRLNETSFETSATDYFFVKDDPTYPIFVFKIPKEVNSLVDHEYKVSKDMESLSIYLPHFNRIFEVKRNVKCYIPDKFKKIKDLDTFNPFSGYNCIRDVLITEYIPSNLTLLKYITRSGFSNCVEPLIHQLILALFIAQQEKNFTHYDLHLENILLRRCFQRTFFWYKFSYEGVIMQRLIYTNSYFPVIFDYGFAYSKGLDGTSYNNSLFFTNKGYTPFVFDDVNDFKTLMVRLAFVRNCPKKFKEVANEKFLKSNNLKFNISRETGWIKTTISSAARIISRRLERTIINLNSEYKDNFIYKELDSLIDLFGTLIRLPLGPNDFQIKTLDNVVQTFLDEWQKIDLWYTSADDKLNIIKKIFEVVNDLILEEEDHSETTRIKKFKIKLFEIFDAFGDFVNVEDLNYGHLLSSIIEISNFIEHMVYAEVQRYNKLFNFRMDGWTMFNIIENLVERKEPYTFQLNDSIVLFDCVEKSTSSFDLKDNDVIEALNTAYDIKTQINIFDGIPKYDY